MSSWLCQEVGSALGQEWTSLGTSPKSFPPPPAAERGATLQKEAFGHFFIHCCHLDHVHRIFLPIANPSNHPPTNHPSIKMSTPSSSQYVYPQSPSASSASDELDSLPDSAPSDDIDSTSSEEEEEESDAEKEWKESLQQLELILTMVLVPYAGKYFGRKCAYWGESCSCSCSLHSYRGGEGRR